MEYHPYHTHQETRRNLTRLKSYPILFTHSKPQRSEESHCRVAVGVFTRYGLIQSSRDLPLASHLCRADPPQRETAYLDYPTYNSTYIHNLYKPYTITPTHPEPYPAGHRLGHQDSHLPVSPRRVHRRHASPIDLETLTYYTLHAILRYDSNFRLGLLG